MKTKRPHKDGSASETEGDAMPPADGAEKLDAEALIEGRRLMHERRQRDGFLELRALHEDRFSLGQVSLTGLVNETHAACPLARAQIEALQDHSDGDEEPRTGTSCCGTCSQRCRGGAGHDDGQ